MNPLVMADVCPVWSYGSKVAVRKRGYGRPVSTRLGLSEVPCGSSVIGVDRDALVTLLVLIVSTHGHKIVPVASDAKDTAGSRAADDWRVGDCPRPALVERAKDSRCRPAGPEIDSVTIAQRNRSPARRKGTFF